MAGRGESVNLAVGRGSLAEIAFAPIPLDGGGGS